MHHQSCQITGNYREQETKRVEVRKKYVSSVLHVLSHLSSRPPSKCLLLLFCFTTEEIEAQTQTLGYVPRVN